jgi:hypothetical protein
MEDTLCGDTLVVGRRTYVCTQKAGHRHLHISPQFAWDGDSRFMAMDEIARRYPRLLAAVKWALIGTASEARSAIEGYVNGYGGSEAVMHYGGPLKCIQGGIRGRHFLRTTYDGYLTQYVGRQQAA